MSARGHAEPSRLRAERFGAQGTWLVHRSASSSVARRWRPRRQWKKVGQHAGLQVILVVALAATAAAETSPLITAARNSDLAAVRALVQQKADVKAAEGDGATALHWASYRDQLEIADVLLRAGADANAANDLGATPLWLAAQNRSAAMTRRLLQAGANPNKALVAGETPLMVAARAGSAEVVELLAAKGANVNAHATRGQTALMWAVAQKHPAVVKVLIARGADVHARSDAWSQVMAVFPHGILDYNRADPARSRHGAAVRGARRRPGVGEAPGRRGRRGGRRRRVGRERDGARGPLRVCRPRGVPARQGRRSQRRQGRLYRAARGDHAPRREDGGGAPRARRRRRRAPRHLDADAPIVARLEFPAGARRRDAAVARRPVCAAKPDAAAARTRRRPAVRAPTRRTTAGTRPSRAATAPPS